MTRRVRSIKNGMRKAEKTEERALRKAGLRDKNLDRPQRLVYHDPDFVTMSAEEMKEKYS